MTVGLSRRILLIFVLGAKAAIRHTSMIGKRPVKIISRCLLFPCLYATLSLAVGVQAFLAKFIGVRVSLTGLEQVVRFWDVLERRVQPSALALSTFSILTKAVRCANTV